jgi:hypothetical protein
MIPALIRPAIGHRPQRFKQVTADIAERGDRNTLAISNSNGRLNHDEAPVAGKQSVRGLLVLPVLRRALPTDTPDREPIAASRHKSVSHPPRS